MDQQPVYGSPMPPPTPGNFDLPPEKKKHTGLIIGLLAGLAVVLLGLLIWVFTMYNTQKNNVDQIARDRVDVALEDQEQQLQANFKKETEATKTKYSGSDVIGSPTFTYPKAWSVYANEEPGGDGILDVALHPGVVNSATKEYALRFRAIDKEYRSVISSYDKSISKGEVRSTPIKSNGVLGVKLSGPVYQGRTGTMVVFGVRDKTIALWTESNDYLDVFNRAVDSLKFQP